MPINPILLNKIYPNTSTDVLESLEKMPEPYKRSITQDDVLNGSFKRYFTRLVNDKNYIIEINSDEYINLKNNPRFLITSIDWIIVGKKETIERSPGIFLYGVADRNKKTVSEADLTFGGLRKYITDYLEYWFAES